MNYPATSGRGIKWNDSYFQPKDQGINPLLD